MHFLNLAIEVGQVCLTNVNIVELYLKGMCQFALSLL